MEERSYWLGFSVFPGVGPGRFKKLLAHFGSARKAWEASFEELIESKIGEKLANAFVDFRTSFFLETYEEKLQKARVSYVTLQDAEYPKLLSEIKNPSFVLFYKGDKKIFQDDNAIGVVGTRKITAYGRQVTEFITRELVEAGCVIVSGLAMGVDAVAHQTTLDAGGKTIAVLGCGVDCCYPRENERLYSHILEKSGLIVSEYGLGMRPTLGSFPSRNRIIAGLSQGILVTEGASDSGALITAKDAIENGRKVFAVPGPVTSSLSQGPNQLIKQGAIVVTRAHEVLEELEISGNNSAKRSASTTIKGDTKEEQRIIDVLQRESLHFDQLVRETKLDPSLLGSVLSLLEVKGVIKNLSTGTFSLIK